MPNRVFLTISAVALLLFPGPVTAEETSWLTQDLSQRPLRNSRTYLFQGTATQGVCQFDYPDLRPSAGADAMVQRDVAVAVGSCMSLR